MADIISIKPDYDISIIIHKDSGGQRVKGPLSRISIGKLVRDTLAEEQDMEITIIKKYKEKNKE